MTYLGARSAATSLGGGVSALRLVEVEVEVEVDEEVDEEVAAMRSVGE
jgi:hypothetical protein